MPQDSEGGGGGGFSGAVGPTISFGLGFGGGFGVGAGRGGGRMGVRGRQEAALKQQIAAANAQILQVKQAEAYRAFEAQNPSGSVGVPVSFNADPKVIRLQKAIQQVVQAIQLNTKVRKEKKLLKREAQLEKKLAKRELATAGETQIRVADIYGPNAGYWRERGAPPPAFLLPGGGF